jgi:ABC-type Na+ efflux pump permease subunit
MRKILTIASREFKAVVGTKAFALSLAMMPVLMFGSLFALDLLGNIGKVEEKQVVVIDPDGEMFARLKSAAGLHNAALDSKIEAQKAAKERSKSADKTDVEEDDEEGEDSLSFSKGSKFFVERIDRAATDELRLELSTKIRNQEINSFVEVPTKVDQFDDEGNLPEVVFYSEESGLSDTKRWVSQTINESVKNKRLARMGIDTTVVQQASTPVEVRSVGLLELGDDGVMEPAVEKDEMSSLMLPFGVMMLMFMIILMSSQPVLESVLEEKSQRIAEVLLGSANPTQLMAGKLLGTVAGSLLVFAIYALGSYFVAAKQGYADMVPLQLLPWFIVFQILGVMFFASIFMSVASAVSQLKEAQSALLPVWMVLMCPLFVWIFIVTEPNSTVATVMSFIPPITPTMMMLRMATGATIPIWQPILGLCLLVVSTMFCIYVAGRIFRVGILWQGKTPKLTEVFRWAVSG